MWIHLFLDMLALVSMLFALRSFYKYDKTVDRTIKDYKELVDDLHEALSRSRWLLYCYKEENDRAWKALEVMKANYNELVDMLNKEGIKNPHE